MMRFVCLVFSSFLLLGCQDVLYSRLSEQQANEVVAALTEAKLKSNKERVDENAWKVMVDASSVGEALVYLRDRGLPSQKSPTIGEVFKKDGMISTPLEERARFSFALQEDIAATLRKIDGVVDARVHVVIPQNDPLSDKTIPTSASVFLKHRALLDAELLAPKIKSLVLASVQGLEYRNVSLFMLPVDGQSVSANKQASVKDLATVVEPVLVAGSASNILPNSFFLSSEKQGTKTNSLFSLTLEQGYPLVGVGILMALFGGIRLVGARTKRLYERPSVQNSERHEAQASLGEKLIRLRLAEISAEQRVVPPRGRAQHGKQTI